MRVINQIFLAAAAAALALVSCTKETTDNTENTQGQKSGVRTITVAFANPDTRTSPFNVTGGIQPVWATGDQLTISNGQTKEKIIVPTEAVEKTTFTFTTELKGTISVYYPGGDSYNTYWDASGNVKISATQTGEFATANLCKGTVAENGTNLTLINQTALFQVTPPSGVKQFTITSLKTIKDGQRTNGTAANIADNATVITVGDNSAELGKCYVALAEGVNLSDLSFEYTTDATHGAMKGIPMKDIAEGKDAVKAGSVYTITADYWHEYVTVAGKKWATMNVGASSPTDYGLYFACGDTVGQKWDGSSWSNGGFNTTPTLSPANPNTLPLQYDAANVNWGGSWRMPTKAEFEDLKILPREWTINYNDTGVNGRVLGGTNRVFVLAAGLGDGTELEYAGSHGRYWSSSLVAGSSTEAYFLDFDNSSITLFNGFRNFGYSVRPLSE